MSLLVIFLVTWPSRSRTRPAADGGEPHRARVHEELDRVGPLHGAAQQAELVAAHRHGGTGDDDRAPVGGHREELLLLLLGLHARAAGTRRGPARPAAPCAWAAACAAPVLVTTMRPIARSPDDHAARVQLDEHAVGRPPEEEERRRRRTPRAARARGRRTPASRRRAVEHERDRGESQHDPADRGDDARPRDRRRASTARPTGRQHAARPRSPERRGARRAARPQRVLRRPSSRADRSRRSGGAVGRRLDVDEDARDDVLGRDAGELRLGVDR